MTDTLSNFQFLCNCLSLDETSEAVSALREEVCADDSRWDQIIALADREMIAPALWNALKKKELLETIPKPSNESLKRRHLMNLLLNQKIKQEAIEVVTHCNQIGVVPIILKGGVHLFEAAPDTFSGRVMRDLDFMVPEDRIESVISILLRMGFNVTEGEDIDWNYCYPSMERPSNVAPIEIHRFVGQQHNILPSEQAWSNAVPLLTTEVDLKALSPTHRVFHNIFHSQIQDRGHELGLLWLRQLYDLAEICRHQAESIDWAALDRLMTQAGLKSVLHCRLYLANRLLSVPLPPEIEPNLQATAHYLRCILLVRWTWAMWTTRLWAAITAPFKKYHIDLIYGCGTNPIVLNIYRLRHSWYIFQKYKGNILRRIWERRHYDV